MSPIYEYRCPECDTRIEARRSAEHRDRRPKCPKDGAVCLRVWQSTPFVFSTYLKDVGTNRMVGL